LNFSTKNWERNTKFTKFTQDLDQLVGKASLGKEISKKQVKKILKREGKSEAWLVCKKGGVEIFWLVKDRSPIYRQVGSPKIDYVSQFEFD